MCKTKTHAAKWSADGGALQDGLHCICAISNHLLGMGQCYIHRTGSSWWVNNNKNYHNRVTLCGMFGFKLKAIGHLKSVTYVKINKTSIFTYIQFCMVRLICYTFLITPLD